MATRRLTVVKKTKKNKVQVKPKLKPRVRTQNQNKTGQKPARRRMRSNKGAQNNNTRYGGPFNMGKTNTRDYRCVIAEETIGIQASNDSNSFGVLNVYNINPGNSTTFPLLSQEASVFETYKFEYLEFYTVPSVSGFAAGGQQGSVSLSVDFNASHPQPISYTAAVDLDPNDEDLPCNDLQIILPPAKMHAQNIAKFIRTGGLPGSSDIKTYDVGNLFVCAEGLDAAQFNVNRLYCRYKCHLYTRVDIAGSGPPQNNSVGLFTSPIGQAAAATTTPFTLTVPTVIANGISAVNTAGTFSLPSGNYLLDVTCVAENSSGDMSFFELDCHLNGTSIFPVEPPALDTGAGSAAEFYTLNFSTYLSLRNTDVFLIQPTCSYSGGTQTVSGSVRITAI